MKSIIRSIKFGLLLALPLGVVFSTHFAFAGTLSDIQTQIFHQSGINIWDPTNCVSGNYLSSICGSTPKEKYWSALRQLFDENHAAAIMGSIVHESDFGPTSWETGINVSGYGGNFIIPWSEIYNNCNNSSRCGGVGGFQISYTLSKYLQYINSSDPSLIRYFQNPSQYNFPGDTALEKLGESVFDKIVELEVKYVMEEADVEAFKQTTTLDDATDWWTINYENCANCCGGADRAIHGTPTCRSIQPRRDSAKKALEEFKGFSCGGSSSSSSITSSTSSISSTSNSSSASATGDITLIGDSVSVQAEKELEAKFPTSFLNKVEARHPTTEGVCDGDENGLATLEKIVIKSGTIINQHADGSCESVTINSGNLKDNIVWELGAHSLAVDEKTLASVINLAGHRNLFLVTPYNGNIMAETDAIAEMYRKLANENDNVYIVDWNKAVHDNESTYLQGDKLRPTEAGSELLADLIASAISSSQGCTTYEGEYPQYFQGSDPRWKDKPYGEGGRTIASAGCGASSMAMLTTVATGQDVFPNDIADTLGAGYYNLTAYGGMVDLDKKVCEKYGCEVIKVPYTSRKDFLEKAKMYLTQGYMLHLSADCPNNSTCLPFSPGGHYIGIFSIKSDGDTVMVADSSHGGNGEYSLKKDIAAFMEPPPKPDSDRSFSAIRGNGNGGNSCNNFCKNAHVSMIGLDETQAQNIADYYNGPATIAYTLPLGLKSNCVSFSYWFVMKFTSLGGFPNGNGKDVANGLITQYNLQGGNEPRPYAVFSTSTGNLICKSDNLPCGHTGIVVSVDGNDVTTLEASYSTNGGSGAQIVHRDISYFVNNYYPNVFAYLDSVLNLTELNAVAGD